MSIEYVQGVQLPTCSLGGRRWRRAATAGMLCHAYYVYYLFISISSVQQSLFVGASIQQIKSND